MLQRHRNPGMKMERNVKPTSSPVRAGVDISGFRIRFSILGAVFSFFTGASGTASATGSANTAASTQAKANKTKARFIVRKVEQNCVNP